MVLNVQCCIYLSKIQYVGNSIGWMLLNIEKNSNSQSYFLQLKKIMALKLHQGLQCYLQVCE